MPRRRERRRMVFSLFHKNTPDALISFNQKLVSPGVIKKTFTPGIVAWIKVLLTDNLSRPRVFRPYWRKPGRPFLWPITTPLYNDEYYSLHQLLLSRLILEFFILLLLGEVFVINNTPEQVDTLAASHRSCRNYNDYCCSGKRLRHR